MEYFCRYQERSKTEVLSKMKQANIAPEFYDEVLSHLELADFLNEARVAREYVLGKFRLKKWGRQKISQQLLTKGLCEKEITKALKQIDFSLYLKNLQMLIEQKMTGFSYKDLYAREKCIAAMMRKGYEYPLILEAYESLKKSLS